ADKIVPIPAVSRVHIAAPRALLRSMGWRDQQYRNPRQRRLVEDEPPELAEQPVVQSCTLTTPSLYPLADALEILEGDATRELLRLAHDGLGKTMVYVPLIAGLLA